MAVIIKSVEKHYIKKLLFRKNNSAFDVYSPFFFIVISTPGLSISKCVWNWYNWGFLSFWLFQWKSLSTITINRLRFLFLVQSIHNCPRFAKKQLLLLCVIMICLFHLIAVFCTAELIITSINDKVHVHRTCRSIVGILIGSFLLLLYNNTNMNETHHNKWFSPNKIYTFVLNDTKRECYFR